MESAPVFARRLRARDRRPCLALLAVHAALVLGMAATPSSSAPLEALRAWITDGRAVEAEAELRTLLAAEGASETLQVAEVLDLLVDALFARGLAASPECMEFAHRAVILRERFQGARHADLGASLVRLGGAELASSLLDEASVHLGRALDILMATRGASDASTSRARLCLASLYTELADYTRARTMFDEELTSLERTLGPEHRDLAKVLFSAARVARRAGDTRDADRLYARALAIGERELGTGSVFVAYVLNGLANLRDDQARYAEARELYERALGIADSQAGPDSPLAASCINNLALVLKRLGDFDAAARHFRRALGIQRRMRESDHAFTASALSNLAELEGLRGNLEEALSLAREAREMRGRIYGPVHPEVAGSLRLEAMLERERGNEAAAIELYGRALAIADSTLGQNHMEVADLLGGLAGALQTSGDIPQARATQERAVAVCEKGAGADDPRTGDALRALGALRFLGGESASAMKAATRAESISREHARLVVGALSETEALRYSEQREDARNLLLTLFSENPRTSSVDVVWNAVIHARSLVLEEISARHRSLAAEGGEQIRALSQQYTAASRALAELLVAGPVTNVAIYRATVDAARRQREKVERQLAARSASFRARQSLDRPNLWRVRDALPRDCALVAYTRYDHGVTEATMSPRYIAFVLRKGAPAVVVPLGQAPAIEQRVADWAAVSSQPDSVNAVRGAGNDLRQIVWDPLVKYVGDARTVLVVPDGALHRINWAALPRPISGYLLDNGLRFHCLLAERDVVPEPPARNREGRGLLVVGGVDFSGGVSPASAAVANSVAAGALVSSRTRFRFEPLPATAAEARSVAARWSTLGPASRDAREKALVLMGADASESAVKQLAPGRRALHLATHGVFLGSAPSAPRSGTRGIGALGSDTPSTAGVTPLLPLSGLALAGANAGRAGVTGAEDGILTAEEIAALDLSGTDLAVLSACDTGRGEVRPGEGVLGLRRAFEVTGVRTLIMSLWSVGDEPTRQWMDAFYEARLARDLGTLDSVDAANRAVLADRRAKGESDHPFYWAAFVAAGEWR